MPLLLRVLVLLCLCPPTLWAQSPAQLKQELRTKETAAKKDPEALYEVGKWAAEKALANDAKRLYQAVLKIKPDHAGANEALGNQLVEGKWLPAKEAEALRKKARDAEFAAKGLVDVDGVWVDKEHVDDAKRGVFHHDGEQVTKAEKIALLAGKVRHPETGELIEGKFAEKAANKFFPVGTEGRWVDQKEADTYHSDIKRPWVVRTAYATIVSTLSLAKIQELKQFVDQGYERVAPVLGSATPLPVHRPVVVIAATRSEYTDLGNAFGDGTDACGSFLAEGPVDLPGLGQVRPAICENEKDMGTRYIRHAAALAYTHAIATRAGVALPPWLLHGIASLTSRFHIETDAGWFGKQHLQRGGVGNVKAFFPSFAISGEMQPTEISHNLYQAGLLLSFAMNGGDKECTDQLQAVTALLSGTGKGNAEKAIAKLQTALIEAQPKIVAYLQQLIAKSP